MNISVSELWKSAKLREKLTILIGLAYIILPFDFIPEIILGPLGLLDDGGALLAVAYTVMAVIKRQNDRRSRVIEGEEVRR
jgi:uncharacterized membrane protein YkvA (DUF1232 family)